MVPGLLVALAIGAPPTDTSAAEAHRDAVARYGVAVWNLRRDRLLTAVKQLEEAAKQDPDATAPQRELVRVYSEIGREPDAIRVAREVLKRDPQDVDIAHALARLLFDAGNTKEAIATAKLAAEIPLSDDRADRAVALYRDLASLCEKVNDHETAELALRKAVVWLTEKRKYVIAAGAFTPKEADTTAASCLERLGKVQTKQRKFDDAIDSFALAAKLYSEKANDAASAARLGWNLSAVYQAKGEPATALEKLEPFLRLKPLSPEPYARLAQLLRDAGRSDEIIPLLRRYNEADSKNLSVQVVLATELAQDPARRVDADRLFDELMAKTNDRQIVEVVVRSHLDTKRPNKIVAMLDRVFTILKDKEEHEKKADTPETVAARAFAVEKARVVADILGADSRLAMTVLKAAAEDVRTGTHRTPEVYFFLGQLAARHRQLELAAVHFREAVQHAQDTSIGDAYLGLIDVLLRARKFAELKTVCNQGLQYKDQPALAPHYLNYRLAQALAELDDAPGAIAAADKAIEQTAAGDRLGVRIGKVFVLQALGKWDDAIALGKKLLDEFDSPADRIDIRYALAGAYWGAKKTEQAEAELRAILDADPDHSGACNDLGYHLAEAGRNLDEAERLIRNAIAVDRLNRKKSGKAELENAAYIDSLGWVLFRQGKQAEARVELERAAAMADGTPDAGIWDHLGDVLFRLGEKPKAKAAWEKALDLYEANARSSARAQRDSRLDEVKRKLKRVQ
jgi:tetratricopeptide (TPR) repeat protein